VEVLDEQREGNTLTAAQHNNTYLERWRDFTDRPSDDL